MTSSALFTFGTRGSPLALAQANEARRRLAEARGWEIERIALKVIRTSGDVIQDRSLAEAGGKGLFTKEIDAALLEGAIDAAVHSAKDLPSIMPDGVALVGYLPREDVRDALISAFADALEGLPHGATLGAASLRRQAQALRLRPDLGGFHRIKCNKRADHVGQQHKNDRGLEKAHHLHGRFLGALPLLNRAMQKRNGSSREGACLGCARRASEMARGRR